jgi:hypothetical protein
MICKRLKQTTNKRYHSISLFLARQKQGIQQTDAVTCGGTI